MVNKFKIVPVMLTMMAFPSFLPFLCCFTSIFFNYYVIFVLILFFGTPNSKLLNLIVFYFYFWIFFNKLILQLETGTCWVIKGNINKYIVSKWSIFLQKPIFERFLKWHWNNHSYKKQPKEKHFNWKG
jgi:hypothetical protein